MRKVGKPFTLAARASGVLLHVTSLPGPHFNGDLGPAARAFVDWLADAGQRFWQMLPVNPIGDGFSPYSTVSSFAGEPLLISLEDLVRDGLLKKSEIKAGPSGKGRRANYKRARAFRTPALRQAYVRFTDSQGQLAAWRKKAASWLEPYVLFQALATRFGTTDFPSWPKDLSRAEPQALEVARRECAAEIKYLVFEQWQFHKQWSALKEYAHARGVGLIGDLPIFVAARSADVWANRSFFFLDPKGVPTVVAGCPPDAFNADGQRWGNALYNWDALAKDGYSWWIQRVARILEQFDCVRLDHFIGFQRYWEIKAKDKTARRGVWRQGPGAPFFQQLAKALGPVEFIAEDLGAVTPEVRQLRDQFHFPGMKVLQFAFDGTAESEHHKPHFLTKQSVVYSGTHDNATTRGWYGALKKTEKALVDTYFGTSAATVAWDVIRAGMSSCANLCVIPAQDLLAQGVKERMNTPGTPSGNWVYRTPSNAWNAGLAARARALTQATDRLITT